MERENGSDEERGDGASEFEREAEGHRRGFLGELWGFLRDNKRWWLTPIIVVLLLFGVLLVIAGTGAAPYIYALF